MKKNLLLVFLFILNSFLGAQWSNIGPSSADISKITGNSNYLFASTESSQSQKSKLFYSSDQGNVWINTGYDNTYPELKIISIASNDTYLFVSNGASLIRTSNLGLSWENVRPFKMNCQKFSVENSNIIISDQNGLGVAFSSNNGANWENVTFNDRPVTATLIKNNIVYISTKQSLLSEIRKSTDFGQTWINMDFNLTTNWLTTDLFADNSNLFVSQIGGYPSGGIFTASLTGSPNWRQINNGINFNLNTYYSCYANAICGNGNNILFSGFGYIQLSAPYVTGLHYSTNNGENWIFTNVNNFTRTLYIKDNFVYAGTTSGILRSSISPVNFQPMGTGLSGADIFCGLAIDPETIYAGSWRGGIYYSSNNGETWKNKSSGLTGLDIKGIGRINSTIYVVSQTGGAFKSDNNGDNWTYIGLSGSFPNSLGVNGNKLLVGAYNRIYSTTNSGVNWVTTYTTNLGGYFDQIVFKNSSNGYARFQPYSISDSPYLLRTADGGASWFSMPYINNITPGYPVVSGNNVLVNAGYFGVPGPAGYLSSNNGASWQPLSIDGNFVSFTATGNDVYMATNETSRGPSKIYKSINNGIDWVVVGSFNYHSLITKLFSDSLNVYAPNWGDGMISRPLPIGINNISTRIPDKFSLNQNYPNPFNPVTKINFDLAKASKVRLAVYNSIGQEVMVLFEGSKPAGSYQAEFNGSSLSSGTYYYRLVTEFFNETKKMQLVK